MMKIQNQKNELINYVKSVKGHNIAPFGEYVWIEDYLHGKFIKWNSNSGWFSKDIDSSIQSFCHWTYHYSKGKYLYCDAQGIRTPNSYILTDPCIISNTENGLKFGPTDMGKEYLNNWFLNHECNNCCKKNWLKPTQIEQHSVRKAVKQHTVRATSFNVTKYHPNTGKNNPKTRNRLDSVFMNNSDIIQSINKKPTESILSVNNTFEYSDTPSINNRIICILASTIDSEHSQYLKHIKTNCKDVIFYIDVCQTGYLFSSKKMVLVLSQLHLYLLNIMKKDLELQDKFELNQIKGDIKINSTSSFSFTIKNKGKYTFNSLMSTAREWKQQIQNCREY